MLLFLHADTRLPPDADLMLLDGSMPPPGNGAASTCRSGRSPLLPIVAGFMNWRSLATGIATGDQAMFATREALAKAGGFPDIPLMEDVELSKRLKRVSRPLCLAARVTTSGRRFDERGAIRTIVLMWRLRLAHFLGAEPEALARRYGYVPRDG